MITRRDELIGAFAKLDTATQLLGSVRARNSVFKVDIELRKRVSEAAEILDDYQKELWRLAMEQSQGGG